MDLFNAVSPIDYRYYGDSPAFRDRLQPYVSENANIAYLLRVEVALVKMLAKWGICPDAVGGQVEAASRDIKAEEVYQEERRDGGTAERRRGVQQPADGVGLGELLRRRAQGGQERGVGGAEQRQRELHSPAYSG